MINQAILIQQDIEKLVCSLRPNATKQFKADMQSYFKRLNSASYRSNNDNIVQVKDKILKKMENSDQKTQLQCHQTINSIMSSNQLTKKVDVLRLLLKLSDMENNSNNSRLFSVDQKITELNQTKQTLLTNTVLQNHSNCFIKPRKSLNFQQLQPLRNRGSIEQGISQIDLLKHITYVMQNIDSTLIRHTEDDTYELQPNINVTETVRNVVTELCSIGWLYKKIIALLKDKGSIEKALTLAVQEEMSEYYRFLAIIENSIQQNTMNLRFLSAWSSEPLNKLKWLALVLESIQPYSGCQIISIVNSYRPHGQEPINNLLNNLLVHMMKPLLHFIHNWMYRGQLIDDNKQFFVEQKQKVSEVAEWFEKYRLVESNIPNILDKQSAQMIYNAGKTIYFLKNRCKCIYSIPIPFINEEKILNSEIYQSSNILSPQFKKWLTSVYENLSLALVNELKHRYHLNHHLSSMRYFYLMGKGDFFQQLVDTLKQEIIKPKHLIYEHNLDGYISDAITKSFQDFRIDLQQNQTQIIQTQKEKTLKTKPEEASEKLINIKGNKSLITNKKQINFENSYRANIIDRLLAKKIDGENAWDAFNFAYSMQKIQPLYSILSPDLIDNYQKNFQFLWKIKRIEHILKEVWMIHQKQYLKTQKNKAFRPFTRILHHCHILRSSMSHFVTNFFGYMMIAIESAWDKFEQSLSKSLSLDEIIKQHRILHTQLSSIMFSSQTKKNLRDSLMNVFKAIEQFKSLENKILSEYSQYVEMIRLYQNRKKIIARGVIEDQELEAPYFNEEEIGKRLHQINDIYDKTFKVFYDNLKKEGEQTNVLVFRLDFSEYFATKQISQRWI